MPGRQYTKTAHVEITDDRTLEVQARGYFRPGQYSGPPERCYESESECEIKHVWEVRPGDHSRIRELEPKDWSEFEERLYEALDSAEEDYEDEDGPEPDPFDDWDGVVDYDERW